MTRRVALGLIVALTLAGGIRLIPPPALGDPALAADATADHFDVQIEAIEVGFAGRYKVGCATAVRVRLLAKTTAFQGHLELTTADADGVPKQVRSGPHSLPAGQSQTVELVVRFGRLAPTLHVAFVAGDARFERSFSGAEMPAAVRSNQELIVCVGPSPDLATANRLLRQGKQEQTQVAQLESAAALPGDWRAYEGVDRLILNTSQPGIYQNLATEGELLKWIELGGRALVIAGQNAGQLADSPLRNLLPGRYIGTLNLRRTAAIEAYTESSDRLGGGRDGSEPITLVVPQFADVQGAIEAFEGTNPRDLPLVIRTPRGLGEIAFTTLDITAGAFKAWPARGQFLNKLLRREPGSQEDAVSEDQLSQLANAGYLDLAGQLRGSLDQFSGGRVLSFWTIATLMLCYVVLISPLDYFMLRRTGISLGWAWLTFPLVVVGIGAGVYLFAHDFKGGQTQLNQVELVDIDVASSRVRGTAWLGMFSPENRQYDLAIEPEIALPTSDPQAAVDWWGLPGRGVGGIDSESQASANPLYDPLYTQAATGDSLEAVPIPVWSSKSFKARWEAKLDESISSDLRQLPSLRLAGTVRNPLPSELRDAVLFFGRLAIPLDDLKAGETASVDRESRSIDTFLTDRKLTGDRDLATPYDRFGHDLNKIVRMISFYEVAGGRSYTRLINRAENVLDLSGHLELGRAILVGRGPAASDLRLDGEPLDPALRDLRLTVYRFVLPVELPEINTPSNPNETAR